MADRDHHNGSVPDWLAEALRLQAKAAQTARPAVEEVRVNVFLWDEYEARAKRSSETDEEAISSAF